MGDAKKAASPSHKNTRAPSKDLTPRMSQYTSARARWFENGDVNERFWEEIWSRLAGAHGALRGVLYERVGDAQKHSQREASKKLTKFEDGGKLQACRLVCPRIWIDRAEGLRFLLGILRALGHARKHESWDPVVAVDTEWDKERRDHSERDHSGNLEDIEPPAEPAELSDTPEVDDEDRFVAEPSADSFGKMQNAKRSVVKTLQLSVRIPQNFELSSEENEEHSKILQDLRSQDGREDGLQENFLNAVIDTDSRLFFADTSSSNASKDRGSAEPHHRLRTESHQNRSAYAVLLCELLEVLFFVPNGAPDEKSRSPLELLGFSFHHDVKLLQELYRRVAPALCTALHARIRAVKDLQQVWARSGKRQSAQIEKNDRPGTVIGSPAAENSFPPSLMI